MLNIKKILDGSALTITLEGRMDTASSARLDADLRSSLGGVTSLVMDLAGLEYISSAGLRVFLYAYKVMSRQGTLKLTRANDVIYGIFEVSGFLDILDIEKLPSDPQGDWEQNAKELTLEANVDNNERFTDFVNAELEAMDCPAKARMQIDTAIDEILTNVAAYAYGDGTGPVSLRIGLQSNPRTVVLECVDSGKAFNPLDRDVPNTISLPADDRPIGGLGIYLVRKLMDDVTYEYRDGKNVLVLKKRI